MAAFWAIVACTVLTVVAVVLSIILLSKIGDGE